MFMTKLSEDQCLEELDTNIKHGNHKSAEAEPTKVRSLLAKDVHCGFSLPITHPTSSDVQVTWIISPILWDGMSVHSQYI
jgi:hypothetical protein